MKKKIIGILICGMLLTTCLVVARPIERNNDTPNRTEPVPLQTNVDAPIWEVGDTWTYKIDDITLSYNSTSQSVYLALSIDQLPLQVTAVNDNSYTASFTTTVSGELKIDMMTDSGPLKLDITFSNLAVSGSIEIEKTNLGIQSVAAEMKGRFRVDIIEQHFINLPLHRIPVPMRMNITADFDTPFAMLTFPLDTHMMWDAPGGSLTVNGKIHSVWFYIILFANNIMKIIGSPFLTDEMAALLPIIDIREALTATGHGNVYPIPALPKLYACNYTQEITVPAGTYTVYNITIADTLAYCYYAPAAGNVVKLQGNFGSLIPYITNIKMELLSTNYS